MSAVVRVISAPFRWTHERVLIELGLGDRPNIVNVHGPTTLMEGVSPEELDLAIERALIRVKRPEVQAQMKQLHAQHTAGRRTP